MKTSVKGESKTSGSSADKPDLLDFTVSRTNGQTSIRARQASHDNGRSRVAQSTCGSHTDQLKKRASPIGSFLFWEVIPANLAEFQFYRFMDYYHQRDHKHNMPINLAGHHSYVTAVLDG